MDILRSELRKDAYKYILDRLSKLQVESFDRDSIPEISLDEIRLIEEGEVDPSSALVASLKCLLKGIVDEREIENYLVKPFEQH